MASAGLRWRNGFGAIGPAVLPYGAAGALLLCRRSLMAVLTATARGWPTSAGVCRWLAVWAISWKANELEDLNYENIKRLKIYLLISSVVCLLQINCLNNGALLVDGAESKALVSHWFGYGALQSSLQIFQKTESTKNHSGSFRKRLESLHSQEFLSGRGTKSGPNYRRVVSGNRS